MPTTRKPARWSGSDEALRAVQVAFDVELVVMDAIRTEAFHNNLSTSDQIRQVLDLSVSTRPKRPRLTVSLTAHDYVLLAQRYGLDEGDRLIIKERVTQDLIRFASRSKRR